MLFAPLALLVSLLWSAPVAQAEAPVTSEYYLSVSPPSGGEQAAREQCKLLNLQLLSASGLTLTPACGLASDSDQIARARSSGRFRYHLKYVARADGTASLGVENWRRRDETDFEELRWNLANQEPSARKAAIESLLGRFAEFDRARRPVGEIALAGCAMASRRLVLNSEGQYLDSATQQVLPFEDAYRLCASETPKQSHYLRAATELAAFLGVGWIIYYATISINATDWDYDGSWASLRHKLIDGHGIRFDDNPVILNSPGHPFAGAIYYGVARSNGFNPLQSFLFAFAGSGLWELLVEYREVVSINDMVFTPVAGAVIGETFHQLSEFFARGEDTLVNRVLSAIFGHVGAFNRWRDKNKPSGVPTDPHGFPADVWHRFDLFAGAAISHTTGGGGSTRAGVGMGIHTQIVNLPGYGRQGEVSRFIHDTAFSELILQSTLGQDGYFNFLFHVKAAFAGYYRQSIRRDERGDLQGYSFFVGPAAAYEMSLNRTDSFLDHMSVVNVLGPSMEVNFYHRGLHVRLMFDVYGDFAAVRSYALEKYGESRSLVGAKEVLQSQRYYFALGITASPKVLVNFRGFEAGAELKYHYFDSLEGLDRHQEEVTDDFSLSDQFLGCKAWIGYRLPGEMAKLAFSIERTMRMGRIRETSVRDDETTFMMSLVLTF